MKKFEVRNGQGARFIVDAVHQVSPSRCQCEGANGTVVIGRVEAGSFATGDKIAFVKDFCEAIFTDTIGRMEISCRQQFKVTVGNNVGMLLMKHVPEELLVLGIPRHHTFVRPEAHPYRL